MTNLRNLRVNSALLYFKYRDALISLTEYKKQLSLLDKEIDKLELQVFNNYLQDNLAFEKPSLKHPR
jgi:hypothetical protein